MISLLKVQKRTIAKGFKKARQQKSRYSTQGNANESGSKGQRSQTNANEARMSEDWSKRLEDASKPSYFSSLTTKLILGATLAVAGYQYFCKCFRESIDYLSNLSYSW